LDRKGDKTYWFVRLEDGGWMLLKIQNSTVVSPSHSHCCMGLCFFNLLGCVFNGNASAGWEHWEPLATFVRRVSGNMQLAEAGVLQTVHRIQDKVDSGEWQ
jgi:hypothetical protein